MADAPRIRYVVSGCLAGLACRYDGGSNPCAAVIRLVEEGRAIPACPESLAGLPVPRLPCELAEGSVLSRDGRDLTEDFLRGAQLALRTAQSRGCTAAILKSRSPSCGFGRIYDTDGTEFVLYMRFRGNAIRSFGTSLIPKRPFRPCALFYL